MKRLLLAAVIFLTLVAVLGQLSGYSVLPDGVVAIMDSLAGIF